MNVSDGPLRTQDQTTRWTAEDARKAGFLAVPLKLIRDIGQPALTMAGVLQFMRTDGSVTHRRQEAIGKAAGVSVRTVRRHLAILEAAGLIQHTRDRHGQTIRLVAKPADLFADGFVPMANYATTRPWVERVVLAWVTYRAELSLGGDTTDDGLKRIAKVLGLAGRVVRRAVRGLEAAGLIAHAWHLPGQPGTVTLRPPATAKRGEDNLTGQGGTIWPVGEDNLAGGIKKPDKKPLVQKKTDHVQVRLEDLAPVAAELFHRCQYHGDAGQAFWKAVGLMVAGLVSENAVRDAAAAVRECQPSDRPAYFWAVLKQHHPDANERVRRLTVTAWPGTPPRPPECVDRPRVTLKRA